MGDASSTASSDGSNIYPVPHATVPYWRTELHEIDSFRSTEELPSECDIAIIGAGMSGVSTLYHLMQGVTADGAKPNVVLLEAREVCSGATGRNGGHSKMQVASRVRLLDRLGPEEAAKSIYFTLDMIKSMKQVVDKEELDCEFELRRSFDVFFDAEQGKQAEQSWRSALQAGYSWTDDISLVPEPHVEEITSIKGAKVAFSTMACSLWPYKFVSQLLARLLKRHDNINLQTHTRVSRIENLQGAEGHILVTPRGSLRAKKVIFASNGYTGGILPTYHDRILPYKGTACHVSPPGLALPHLGHTYNINHAPGRVNYLNPRPDGGIVFGGAHWEIDPDPRVSLQMRYNNWDDSTLFDGVRNHFGDYMQRNFRGWDASAARMDRLWTGIMGYTQDGQPHVGKVVGEQRQWILAGFNGGGMSYIWTCAKAVAKMVLDDCDFEQTGVPMAFKTQSSRLEKWDPTR